MIANIFITRYHCGRDLRWLFQAETERIFMVRSSISRSSDTIESGRSSQSAKHLTDAGSALSASPLSRLHVIVTSNWLIGVEIFAFLTFGADHTFPRPVIKAWHAGSLIDGARTAARARRRRTRLRRAHRGCRTSGVSRFAGCRAGLRLGLSFSLSKVRLEAVLLELGSKSTDLAIPVGKFFAVGGSVWASLFVSTPGNGV